MGTEGIIWLTSQIRKDITTNIDQLVELVKKNKVLLLSRRDNEDGLKQLSQVPSFVFTCIDIGKKLGLLHLVVEAHEEVTRQRAPYLHALMDLMITPEVLGFIPFQLAESTLTIAEAMGLSWSDPVPGNTDTETSQMILDMLECLLPLLANLNSSRYFQTSLHTDPVQLDSHRNSINCLGDAVKMLIKEDRAMLDFNQFIKETLALPLGSYKNTVGALVLGLSIVSEDRYEQKNCLPFSLSQAANIKSAQDSRQVGSESLEQELQQKRVAKLMKRSKQ